MQAFIGIVIAVAVGFLGLLSSASHGSRDQALSGPVMMFGLILFLMALGSIYSKILKKIHAIFLLSLGLIVGLVSVLGVIYSSAHHN
jgi:uncharacterized membrane protein